VVKDRYGNLHDARTGEFVSRAGPHPRKLGKLRFATILQPWAREKYTPGVKITKPTRKRRST
jgi:hypothetical protein